MSTITVDFCKSLAGQCPDIADILTEHLADNGELLPHVFLADVTRYLLADGRCRMALVKYFEESFTTKGPDVEDLIAVSFVEYLDANELRRVTEGIDAPHLQAEWDRQQIV